MEGTFTGSPEDPIALAILAGSLFYDQGPPCTPVGLAVLDSPSPIGLAGRLVPN